jgi:hypothetical protein
VCNVHKDVHSEPKIVINAMRIYEGQVSELITKYHTNGTKTTLVL